MKDFLLKENLTDKNLELFTSNISQDLINKSAKALRNRSYNNSTKSKKKPSILLVPPDISRLDSKAGKIVELLHKKLSSYFSLTILPATGLHASMTDREKQLMFGADHKEMNFSIHDPQKSCVSLGEYELMTNDIKNILDQEPQLKKILQQKNEISNSLKIDLKINKLVFEYDLVFSIGQVLPHEVLGVSNFTKNIIIGLGGIEIIEKTHFLSSIIGLFKIITQVDNPIRDIIDDIFFSRVKAINSNIDFILTVLNPQKKLTLAKSTNKKKEAVYWINKKESFKEIAQHCLNCNVVFLPKKLKRVYAWMPPVKYSTVWVANKAIYRLGEIVEKNGELIIIALGVKAFSDQPQTNEIIKGIGYHRKPIILKKIYQLKKEGKLLKNSLATFAHLIHGGDVNFKVTYCINENADQNTDKKLSASDLKKSGFSFKGKAWGEKFYQDKQTLFQDNSYTEEVGYFYDPGLLTYKIKK